jgi:hypothetical protein
MMINKITFIPTKKEVELMVDPPKPAKLCIPKWFKDIPAVNEKNVEISFNGMPDTNLKNCMPFFDSLVSGYIQETWSDIVVQKDKDGDITYNQSSSMSPTIMNHREKTHMPIANSFYDFEFVWNQVWIPKLPDGYSYLFLNPLNRVDLPFYTSSAIVDADKVNYSTQGSIPFYIKKDFVGIIPKGTPMYQMIPFKRQSWAMSLEEYDEELTVKGVSKLRSKFVGYYKDNYWSKKEYN